MDFCVYILYSSKCDKYYVGHTESIDARLYEHNNSKGGKFSKTYTPWQLMHNEIHDAMKREKEIKSKKSRKYIGSLIGSIEPHIERSTRMN